MAEGVAPEIKHLISWISEGSFRAVCTVFLAPSQMELIGMRVCNLRPVEFVVVLPHCYLNKYVMDCESL